MFVEGLELPIQDSHTSESSIGESQFLNDTVIVQNEREVQDIRNALASGCGPCLGHRPVCLHAVALRIWKEMGCALRKFACGALLPEKRISPSGCH
jgi:hypothetical protein